jgi:hypothetical protein
MLKDAAKELGVNYSTAKTIIRIFRLENRIHKKYSSNPKLRKLNRFKFIESELSVTHKSVNISGKAANEFIKCNNMYFTIGGVSDSTQCSSELEYSKLNCAMVYYVRMAQKGIEEFQVLQNNLIIRNLVPICESIIKKISYFDLLPCNSMTLMQSYYNLLCKHLT